VGTGPREEELEARAVSSPIRLTDSALSELSGVSVLRGAVAPLSLSWVGAQGHPVSRRNAGFRDRKQPRRRRVRLHVERK
jgi:hypothetical protein